MARSLNQIIAQVDAAVEKRASSPYAPRPSLLDEEDLFKLAAQIRDYREVPQEEPRVEYTENEKLAAAVLWCEVIAGRNDLLKIAHIESACKEKNISQEITQALVDKVASSGVGQHIYDVLEGAGHSLKGVAEAIRGSGDSAARSVGRAAGVAVPAAALLGGGAYLGSKYKEHQIKKKLGYST
jgi:hypothetical protein